MATFIEKRPTCVSVIGWAWIVLGGMMCFGATIGIVGSIVMADANPPLLMKLFPFLAIAQIGLGLTGLVAGINFLKLKAWSRPILEGLTWFLLMFVVGFMIFWEYMWITQVPVGPEPEAFKWMGVVMGLVISCLYIAPLVIMLKYLRGAKVRSALRDDGLNEYKQERT